MKDSSARARKKARKASYRLQNKICGINSYYAFPVMFAVLLWFLLSHHLYSQFAKAPKEPNELSEIERLKLQIGEHIIYDEEDENIEDLAVTDDDLDDEEDEDGEPFVDPRILSYTKRAARQEFLSNLNESIALKVYKSRFSSSEVEYKDHLLKAEHLIDVQEYKEAMHVLKSLAHVIPRSPRFLYASAVLIDRLSEFERSNGKLKQSVEIYKKLLALEKIDSSLLYLAGRRLINRLQFLGKHKSAILQNEMLNKKIPNNVELMNELGINLLIYNRIDLAKEQFEKVLLMSDSQDMVALCHYAFILKTNESKLVESVEMFAKCLLSKEKAVMDARFFYHVGDALQKLGRRGEAYKYYQIGVENGLFPSVTQRSLYNVPNLKSKPWWSLKETGYDKDLKILEENWKYIRNEAFSQMNKKTGAFLTDSATPTERGDWKDFNLFSSGRKIEKSCEKAPYTCYLLEQIPAASSCQRCQIKFSILNPGTRISPHCGPTNSRLRANLGLRVPQGAHIRVGSEERYWKDGAVLVFDESYEHEIWHNGTEFRLVLIVDLWHPDLTDFQKAQLSPLGGF